MLEAVSGRFSDDEFDIVQPYGDIDRQMKQAQNELSQLQEEEMLRKSLELQKMRQQLAEKKETVKKLRGKNIFTTKEKISQVSKTHKTVSSEMESENEITIQFLREDNKFKKKLSSKRIEKAGFKV